MCTERLPRQVKIKLHRYRYDKDTHFYQLCMYICMYVLCVFYEFREDKPQTIYSCSFQRKEQDLE